MVRATFDQDLVVDRLSPPPRGRMGRSLSRSYSLGSRGSPAYEYRDFPPFSQRSRSTIEANFSDSVDDDDDEDGDEGLEASPRLPEAVLAMRRETKDGGRRGGENAVVDEGCAVPFSKPEVDARKFVWIHLPYNNPTWVTVS